MTHRAEQILDAVMTAVTGLTTTGARVARARVDHLATDSGPALSVAMGADTPVATENMAFLDRTLEVTVTAHVKDATDQVDEVLNTIRREIYVALMANRTLGLAWVFEIEPLGDGAPEIDGESDVPVARQETNWAVTYRHSLTDPAS